MGGRAGGGIVRLRLKPLKNFFGGTRGARCCLLVLRVLDDADARAERHGYG